MDDLLINFISETQDNGLKSLAESLISLEDTSEELEKRLISDGHFWVEQQKENDK
ncbi:MAG: hypothetical protein WCQ96_01130 [Patescibacteria group bacterium]